MKKRKGSYRLTGSLHVPLLHSFYDPGGLMHALAWSIRPEVFLRSMASWDGAAGDLLRSLAGDSLCSVLGEDGGRGLDELLDALWLTPSSYRKGVLAVVEAALRSRPGWAADPRVGELVHWLRKRKRGEGAWRWLMGAERAMLPGEFAALTRMSREAAMVLWVVDLRGKGWGGKSHGSVPAVLRVGGPVMMEALELLAQRMAKGGLGGLRLVEWLGFGNEVLDQVLSFSGLRRRLVDAVDLAGMERETVRVGQRWLRICGGQVHDVGDALRRVARWRRTAESIPWALCLDHPELREEAVRVLLGEGVVPAVVPTHEDVCDALDFVVSPVLEKRRRIRMGGSRGRPIPAWLTKLSDWDDAFDDLYLWGTRKTVPSWMGGPVGDIAWEWMRVGLMAGAGQGAGKPSLRARRGRVRLGKVLAAAFPVMARVRPVEMLRWWAALPEDGRRNLLGGADFLAGALMEAVGHVPAAAALELAPVAVWVLAWHGGREARPGSLEQLVRSVSRDLRREMGKVLAVERWDAGMASLAVALGRAFPRESRRLAARRQAESGLLIRGMNPLQLEKGGWGKEWRKAGPQAWPLSGLFGAESALRPEDHATVAWVLALEDPDRLLLQWLRWRPVRAAAVNRHGEATVALAERLLRSGELPGIRREDGDGQEMQELQELLEELRQEEAEVAARVAVLADPRHAGPASLAALALDGKLRAVQLQEIGRDRLQQMLPAAAALAPERPAVWQALELSLWIGLRWFHYLIRLAVARTAHHRSGGVAGHVYDDCYEVYELPKRSGGKRRITAPRRLLRELQRDVLRKFEQETGIQPEENAHGFVPGRSTLTNALPHAGQAVVVNIDIRGFFPSTPGRLIQRAVRRVAGERLSRPVVYLLADLCTHAGVLPTGAPTSPWIANLVLAGADKALRKAAAAAGLQYTRYADDLTFSGDSRAVGMIRFARKVLGGLGYELDPKKINIFRRGRRQVVTGLVVNERVNLPRQVRRRIRAAVHAVSQGREPRWHGRPVSVGSVHGALGWWHLIHPEQVAGLIDVFRKATGGKDG